ncbi:hypothetical protein P152DRAFT_189307 [Eremomyces bilateralis CBS 781.70]|uniref:Uncharacterized protein n=1 Tax=Eremomyces bilateralis CBS 781.70 TaxID=1392243 RepID=A0A6G1GCD0_9PEZI|nr:uncharacterized protein P152DRAFT_189307 [Eremomyces bilateralis CBS 781.70]KAF1815576.1 hypothetical protein P152DRAFT_189307 [Eremomyces bilateralis CBS 781.70]
MGTTIGTTMGTAAIIGITIASIFGALCIVAYLIRPNRTLAGPLRRWWWMLLTGHLPPPLPITHHELNSWYSHPAPASEDSTIDGLVSESTDSPVLLPGHWSPGLEHAMGEPWPTVEEVMESARRMQNPAYPVPMPLDYEATHMTGALPPATPPIPLDQEVPDVDMIEPTITHYADGSIEVTWEAEVIGVAGGGFLIFGRREGRGESAEMGSEETESD